MTARIARTALRLTLTLILVLTLAPVVLSAREVRVAPKIFLPRGLDKTRTVYVELTITDGNKSYMNRGQIGPGSSQITIKLKGVPYDRNYIVVARASNTSNFSGETVVLRAVIRKLQVASGTSECPVELRNASTIIANAVLLYLQNTALSLNETDATGSTRVENALDAILAASDPIAEAESRSTVTVTGTVTDVLGDPLPGITVAAVDCTPSALTLADGVFTLPKVPVRCTSLRAQHVVAAPQVSRYVAKTHALSPLSAPGGPAPAGTIALDPDPQAVRGDLGTALSLMADNTGDLAEWLSEPFVFNRAVPVELQPPVSETRDKAAFVLEIPPQYVEIAVGSDFVKIETGVRTYSFTSTWISRHAGTFWREKSAASGTIVYGNRRWQLSSLTLANPVVLPRPPAGFTAAGGDGRAILSWQAPSDMDGITGFLIFRSQLAGTIPTEPISETLGANSRTYTDVNLSTGTYYYWICSVEQYGAQTVRGPLTPMATAVVYDSYDTIKQFMECAKNRDQAGMESLLDDSFTAFMGVPVGKAEFIDWVLNTLFMPGDPVGGPVHEWKVQSPVSKSVQNDYSELRLKAYMVGRQNRIETKYSRWIEELQGWKVQADEPHLISWFGPTSRTEYPAPIKPECLNPQTTDTDGFARLQWSAPVGDPDAGAQYGYYILRSETNDWDDAVRISGSELLPGTTTIYDDTGIVAGKVYYYWVIAQDNYGLSSLRPENEGFYLLVAGLPPEVWRAAREFLEGSAARSAARVLAVSDSSCWVYFGDGSNTLNAPISEYVKFQYFELADSSYSSFRNINETQYDVTYNCTGCVYRGIAMQTVTLTIKLVGGVWVITLASYHA